MNNITITTTVNGLEKERINFSNSGKLGLTVYCKVTRLIGLQKIFSINSLFLHRSAA